MRRIRRKASADRGEQYRAKQEIADKLHPALERDLRLEAPDRRERPPCQNRRKRQQRGYPIPDTPAAPELCDETKKGKHHGKRYQTAVRNHAQGDGQQRQGKKKGGEMSPAAAVSGIGRYRTRELFHHSRRASACSGNSGWNGRHAIPRASRTGAGSSVISMFIRSRLAALYFAPVTVCHT